MRGDCLAPDLLIRCMTVVKVRVSVADQKDSNPSFCAFFLVGFAWYLVLERPRTSQWATYPWDEMAGFKFSLG